MSSVLDGWDIMYEVAWFFTDEGMGDELVTNALAYAFKWGIIHPYEYALAVGVIRSMIEHYDNDRDSYFYIPETEYNFYHTETCEFHISY